MFMNFWYLFRLLPRVNHLVILPDPDLGLLLGDNMLDKHLARVLGLELADPPRIPQLAGNAQVLAAPHQRVGLAPFRRCRDAVGAEIVLFAAGDGDEAVVASSVLL